MESGKVLERKGSGIRGQEPGTRNPAFSGTSASLQPATRNEEPEIRERGKSTKRVSVQ